MDIKLSKKSKPGKGEAHIIAFYDDAKPDEVANSWLKAEFEKDKSIVSIPFEDGEVHYLSLKKKDQRGSQTESARLMGFQLCGKVNASKAKSVLVESSLDPEDTLGLVEGIALSNYQFLKYFKDAKKRKNSLKGIQLNTLGVTSKDIKALDAAVHATYEARDLVNEPLSYLTAVQYSKEMKRIGNEFGFTVETFNEKKIQSLKMGGVLAVNRGSVLPPTFNILEYKGAKAKNKKPIVMVGKGVVYDTGGLSLKPTPNSMDFMKCDMGGSAAVVGAIAAAAKAELPLYIVALVPAVENRPGGNAYAPGDVITMYDGSTVEVLNTDAEGRLIMADALAYAQKYKPELVVDMATLTGAAARAIGGQGVVSMGTADQSVHDKLSDSGYRTYERIAQFPFWDEYSESLKSAIADQKNLGGPDAGMITAGKFLEAFTKKDGKHAYPWIHIDIAGPAFAFKPTNYRGVQGTGVGVRLMFDFLRNY
jgi:leucyl aminopeptidase